MVPQTCVIFSGQWGLAAQALGGLEDKGQGTRAGWRPQATWLALRMGAGMGWRMRWVGGRGKDKGMGMEATPTRGFPHQHKHKGIVQKGPK